MGSGPGVLETVGLGLQSRGHSVTGARSGEWRTLHLSRSDFSCLCCSFFVAPLGTEIREHGEAGTPTPAADDAVFRGLTSAREAALNLRSLATRHCVWDAALDPLHHTWTLARDLQREILMSL